MFLSFIIPAFNVEKYISKTLESLLAQTDKDFEVIVIDDGSTDGTRNVVTRTLSKSGFRHYRVISEENRGASFARNVGIKNAEGEYILFLDGDDYVAPSLVEEVKKKAEASFSQIVFWKFRVVSEEGQNFSRRQPSFDKLSPERIYRGEEILRSILIDKNAWICIGSAAFRKDFVLANSLFFTENCRYGEDPEFTLKALCLASRIAFVNKTLLFYVQRRESISRTISLDLLQFPIALERVEEFIKNNRFWNQEEFDAFLKAVLEYRLISFCRIFALISCSANRLRFKEVLQEIDKAYPGLFCRAFLEARGRKDFVSKLYLEDKIGVRLFSFSPVLFFYFSKLYLPLRDAVKSIIASYSSGRR